MTRARLILVGLAIVLGGVAALVAQKEALLARGETVYLQLAPVDPRSLIQGDYMTLSYAIANEFRRDGREWPEAGRLVLALDERRVASLVRLDDGTPLAPGQLLLRYRKGERFPRLGAEAFFFQEGQADLFARAKYGELKVASSGTSVLVGLRGPGLEPLGPQRR